MMRENFDRLAGIFDREKQRAVYFDYYKAKYQISVIIYTFSKECATYGTFRKGSDLARQIELQRALGLAYHEKQICVSKKESINKQKQAPERLRTLRCLFL